MDGWGGGGVLGVVLGTGLAAVGGGLAGAVENVGVTSGGILPGGVGALGVVDPHAMSVNAVAIAVTIPQGFMVGSVGLAFDAIRARRRFWPFAGGFGVGEEGVLGPLSGDDGLISVTNSGTCTPSHSQE